MIPCAAVYPSLAPNPSDGKRQTTVTPTRQTGDVRRDCEEIPPRFRRTRKPLLQSFALHAVLSFPVLDAENVVVHTATAVRTDSIQRHSQTSHVTSPFFVFPDPAGSVLRRTCGDQY